MNWDMTEPTTCIYHTVYADQIRGKPGHCWMKWRFCGQPTATGQFCEEHRYCNELLQHAALAGYPRWVAAYLPNWQTGVEEPVVTIGEGYRAWEAYAVHHALRHHSRLLRGLSIRIDYLRAEHKRTEAWAYEEEELPLLSPALALAVA